MLRHNEQTQLMADALARESGDFCAVYYGRLTSERRSACPFLKPYDGLTLVYISRKEQSCDTDEPLRLILVQSMEVSVLEGAEALELAPLVTGRNQFARGRELFEQYKKRAFASRVSKTKQHQARQIVLASKFHGQDSRKAMRMVCEYLEIADRFDMQIEVKKCTYWDDEDGGVDFYLQLS